MSLFMSLLKIKTVREPNPKPKLGPKAQSLEPALLTETVE